MIATNLLPQCIAGETRKALALLVFSCAICIVSFSQSGSGITNNGIGHDLVGPITTPATLTLNTGTNFNIQGQSSTSFFYVKDDGLVGLNTTSPYAQLHLIKNDIRALQSDANGLLLQNLQPADNTHQLQYSPGIVLEGSGYNILNGSFPASYNKAKLRIFNKPFQQVPSSSSSVAPFTVPVFRVERSLPNGDYVSLFEVGQNRAGGSTGVFLTLQDDKCIGVGGGFTSIIAPQNAPGVIQFLPSSFGNSWMDLSATGMNVTPIPLTAAAATGALNITQAWNTLGNPAAIKLNIVPQIPAQPNVVCGNTSLLMDLQVQGQSQFSVTPAGYVRGLSFFSTGGLNQTRFTGYQTTLSSSGNITVDPANPSTGVRIINSFGPTSAAGYNGIMVEPTISQSGPLGTGITRGILINPTLTSAPNWRSIEFKNNTGWGIYGDCDANNFLKSGLSLGTTDIHSSALLNVNSTTKGVLMPRMTTGQRDLIFSPEIGLEIYNTTTDSKDIYTSTGWISLRPGPSGEFWALGGNGNTVPGTNFIGTTDDKRIVFKAGLSGNEAATILPNSGFVGIGKPAPNSKLDVAGKIITEDLQVNRVAPANGINIPPPGYVLASEETNTINHTSNGTLEWKNPADLGGIKWTARRLGLRTDGTDNTPILTAALAADPNIHSIWFESDFSSEFTFATPMSLGNRVLKFERGNRLTGDGSLSNFIIDASPESKIFDIDFDISGVKTSNGIFSVKWFGANDKSIVPDSYKAIQKSINTCLSNGIPQLFIPAGSYEISKPLLIRDGNGFEIFGQSQMWHGPTSITATFNDAFAIGIQRGKSCKIRNLAINGRYAPPKDFPANPNLVTNAHWYKFLNRNLYTSENGNNYINGTDAFYDTNPIESQIPGDPPIPARDNRYSPYAGIVIDPFYHLDLTKVDPDDPNPTLDMYPGLVTEYNNPKNGSSTAISIEEVSIGGFIVGIASSPNKELLGAEMTKISRVKINDCKVAISGGQSQEKVNVVDGLSCWYNVHTVFATNLYGSVKRSWSKPVDTYIPDWSNSQAGAWNLKNWNIAGTVVQLVYNAQRNWYPIYMDNIYAEGIASFGLITSESSISVSNSTQVSNSIFNFAVPSIAGVKKLAVTDQGVTFKNCRFEYYGFNVPVDPQYKGQEIFHPGWKSQPMMVFDGLNTTYEDCKFSGVPVQEKEMDWGFLNRCFNIYKNCTAGKYEFGKDAFKYADRLTVNGGTASVVDYVLFNNKYKVFFPQERKYGRVTETYEFEGNETFVNFYDKPFPAGNGEGQYGMSGKIELISVGAGNPSYRAVVSVMNTDAFEVGSVAVFSQKEINTNNPPSYLNPDNQSYLDEGGCYPMGYGIIMEKDKNAKTITVSYLSNTVKSTAYWQTQFVNDPQHGDPYYLRLGYAVSCLYPAVQSGSFLGDISQKTDNDGNIIHESIGNVAADIGLLAPEYVGNLIKCPYNESRRGWVKITGYTGVPKEIPNPDYPGEGNPNPTNIPKTVCNPDYDAHKGIFDVLGNIGSHFKLNEDGGRALYFHNGATKAVEMDYTRAWTIQGQWDNGSTMLVHRGEKLIEKNNSDYKREYVAVQTGYNRPTAFHPSGTACPEIWQSGSENRQGCIAEIFLPGPGDCNGPAGRPAAKNNNTNAWNLTGNTIVANNAKDSTEEEADADTTQFLGTKNNVGLRIKTGNKERMAIDKNGVVTVGEVDLKTITNHKDPKQNYQFAVKGNAIFERAVVKLSTNWPDFVFDEKYKLMSLEELEKYIQENKHLPGLPPAEKAEKEGVDVGNHQAALLNKLEEMTLYILQQNKKAEEQNKQIEELKAQNSQLLDVQKQIDELKKAITKQPAKPAE